MQEISERGSEVARLLTQISAEYQAAQRALGAFAQGTAKHEFISARMTRMERLHDQLQSIVGESAIALIADTISKVY